VGQYIHIQRLDGQGTQIWRSLERMAREPRWKQKRVGSNQQITQMLEQINNLQEAVNLLQTQKIALETRVNQQEQELDQLHQEVPTRENLIQQLAQGVTTALQNQPQALIQVTVQQPAQQQQQGPPVAPTRRITAKEPPEFSGTVEETEGFIQSCELYYVLKQAEFQNLGQWITYVL
jgi:type IV secretory pathway VirJ component